MKYGIIVHRPTSNIGDDIQSIACENLLPQKRVDYFIDRENIDVFDPVDDVAVVMSGWWMWKKFNWPPSSKIIPYFVGYHYQSFRDLNYWHQVGDEDYLGNGIGRRYYETYSPVGCRDYSTLSMMQKYDIPSYFSGCITLTLSGYDNPELKKQKYVVCNDISDAAEEHVRKELAGTGIEVKTVTHNIPSVTEFDWSARRKRADAILELYKNALCVVTFRLHASLPCLALGTPVLLVRKSLDNTRFHPYSDWLHWSTENDFVNGKCDYSLASPPPNSGMHIPCREQLISGIADFYRKAEAGEIKPFYQYCPEIDILRWRVEMLRNTSEEYRVAYQNAVHEKKVMEKAMRS